MAEWIRAAIGLGCLFAWILTVPLGPLGLRSGVGALGLSGGELFALFHSTGLVALGMFGARAKSLRIWSPWAGAGVAVLGLAWAVAPAEARACLLALAGIAAALGACAVGQALARLRPGTRAWGVALGAFLGNVPLQVLGLPMPLGEDRVWAAVLAVLPMATPLVLKVPHDGGARASGLRRLLLLVPAMFVIYLVRGLMYGMVWPHVASSSWVGVLPYMALLPAAGLLTAPKYRLWAAKLGVLTMGFGWLLWTVIPGQGADVVIQALIVGSYAFLDIYFWTTLADHRGDPFSAFGLGLGAMVLGIFFGMVLSPSVAAASLGHEQVAALLAMGLTLAAVTLLPSWAPGSHRDAEAEEAVGWYHHGQLQTQNRWKLSPRQMEILLYVAQGMTNKEIARQLQLQEGTVRKHMERVFTRMGVRSRAEAVALFLMNLKGESPKMDSGRQGGALSEDIDLGRDASRDNADPTGVTGSDT